MKNIFKFITLTLLVSFITLCIVLFFPFFNFKTFKPDRSKQYPDLSMYGFDQNYKIQFNAPTQWMADVQAANYFCVASNNLGIDCQVFYFMAGDLPFQNKLYQIINDFIITSTKPIFTIDIYPFIHTTNPKIPYKNFI